MTFLSPRGLRTSRTIKMRLHVRATGGLLIRIDYSWKGWKVVRTGDN